MHLRHTQPGAGVLRVFLDGVLELRQGLFEASPLKVLLRGCEVFVFLGYHLKQSSPTVLPHTVNL